MFYFYSHFVLVQYKLSLVHFPDISMHCIGVIAFSFRDISEINFSTICYLTILNILYFCISSAAAARNLQKLFNSNAQASINYLTVLSHK